MIGNDELTLSISNGIATITISRPEKRNAFNLEIWLGLSKIVDQALSDLNIRVLVVRGSPGADFSVGGDITEFSTERQGIERATAYSDAVLQASERFSTSAIPTIAAIEGFCVGGGCQLALACDLRMASSAAVFGITPAKLGIVYSLSATKRLVDTVGPSWARYLLLTARMVSAREAAAMGLIHEIHEPDAFENSVDVMAQTVASLASSTHSATKRIVELITLGAVGDGEETSKLYQDSYVSDDYLEGLRAFLDGGPPKFNTRLPRGGSAI